MSFDSDDAGVRSTTSRFKDQKHGMFKMVRSPKGATRANDDLNTAETLYNTASKRHLLEARGSSDGGASTNLLRLRSNIQPVVIPQQ